MTGLLLLQSFWSGKAVRFFWYVPTVSYGLHCVTDGWPSVCLSRFPLSFLFLSFLTLVLSVSPSWSAQSVFSAVHSCAWTYRNSQWWEQLDRVWTHEVQEGEKEWEFGPAPLSIPFQSQAQQDSVPAFYLTARAINRTTRMVESSTQMHSHTQVGRYIHT